MSESQAKKRILLHSCCGPCSTAVTERLSEDGEAQITLFYYNPNITDPAEYEHRKAEQKRFLAESGLDIRFLEGPYDPEEYYTAVRGLEQEPEGGARCAACFALRLEKTAALARELGFDAFDTTLSVSPYKNYETIRSIAEPLAERCGLEYLAGNYKKKDGYKRSIELSRQYGLYRQHYCGCEFSKP